MRPTRNSSSPTCAGGATAILASERADPRRRLTTPGSNPWRVLRTSSARTSSTSPIGGQHRRLAAEWIVIAVGVQPLRPTGHRLRRPNGPRLGQHPPLVELARRLVVIGAGLVGLEYASRSLQRAHTSGSSSNGRRSSPTPTPTSPPPCSHTCVRTASTFASRPGPPTSRTAMASCTPRSRVISRASNPNTCSSPAGRFPRRRAWISPPRDSSPVRTVAST